MQLIQAIMPELKLNVLPKLKQIAYLKTKIQFAARQQKPSLIALPIKTGPATIHVTGELLLMEELTKELRQLPMEVGYQM